MSDLIPAFRLSNYIAHGIEDGWPECDIQRAIVCSLPRRFHALAQDRGERAHSRFPGHALTPTGVMAIRCKQFHLPDL